GAHAVARHHDASDGFLRALHERRGTEGITQLHGGHLAHEDRHAIVATHHDVLDVAHAFDQAEAADDGPRTARLHDVAADVSVAGHDGVDHGGERNPVRAQALGIDVDLVLPDRAADAGDFRDTRHGVQLVADEPVLNGPEVSQGHPLAFDRVPEDVPDTRGVGAKRGHDAGGGARARAEPAPQDAGGGGAGGDVVLPEEGGDREN